MAGLLALSSALFLAACGGGGGGGGGGPPPPPPQSSVTISGKISYERVPFSPSLGAGLDYSRITATPARGIVVQLLKAVDSSVLATVNTDASGNYSFPGIVINTDVIVRARAQSVSTGSAGQPATWSVSIKDNTNSNALYVMDSATFNTGVADQTKNLLADSGWPAYGGTSYTGTRVAAPFAILDSLYSAVQFVVTQGDNTIVLPALDVYWSPLNKASTSNPDPTIGNIETTAYRSNDATFPSGIYVLGDQNNDTDEYDEHVLTHEFNHYLQDHLGRDDTPGGPHSFNEKVDLRVAFSEGFANAFSGMTLNDPLYRDSYGTSQGTDFYFNLETDNYPSTYTTPGWFSEVSVASIVWDLFDTAADGVDTVTIPYSSMLNVLRGTMRTGQPLTSIFPFIVALKGQVPAQAAGIDALVAAQGMVAPMDAFATTETNDGGVGDTLPIYTDIALNGPVVTVCGNADAGYYNKIGNRRFLKFSLAAPLTATITVQYTATGSTAPFTPTPNPDFQLYKGGYLLSAASGTANIETLTQSLDAGDYVLEVYDYSHVNPSTTASRRGRTCMNVTITG